MKTLVTGLFALSSLAFAAPAMADHHGGAAEDRSPSRDTCMQMHEAMMARHEAGEDHDAIIASLTEDEREQAQACHDRMGEHHEGHGDAGDQHAEDDAHGEHASDHGQEAQHDAGHH